MALRNGIDMLEEVAHVKQLRILQLPGAKRVVSRGHRFVKCRHCYSTGLSNYNLYNQ
jgi:hypothetical protein